MYVCKFVQDTFCVCPLGYATALQWFGVWLLFLYEEFNVVYKVTVGLPIVVYRQTLNLG